LYLIFSDQEPLDALRTFGFPELADALDGPVVQEFLSTSANETTFFLPYFLDVSRSSKIIGCLNFFFIFLFVNLCFIYAIICEKYQQYNLLEMLENAIIC